MAKGQLENPKRFACAYCGTLFYSLQPRATYCPGGSCQYKAKYEREVKASATKKLDQTPTRQQGIDDFSKIKFYDICDVEIQSAQFCPFL